MEKLLRYKKLYESLILFILRSAISKWFDSKNASEMLGFSEKSLNCWRRCGYLKSGKHWRMIQSNFENIILYNVDQCSIEMHQWWDRDAISGP